jgi:hypothetical protein
MTGARSKFLLLTALVLLAVAAWLANSNNSSDSQLFFIANRDLPKSTTIDEGSVHATPAQLSESNEMYLKANEGELGKWYLTKPVLAGELIPLSAIASVKEANCTPIILTLGTNLPSEIKVGSNLDIWAAEQASSVQSVPYEVAVGSELIAIKSSSDGIGQNTESIEVCISIAEVRSVVDAIAKRATVVAVRAIK